MPSPTSTTVPTLRVSVVSSNPSMADLMMLMISSDLIAIGSPFRAGVGWCAGSGPRGRGAVRAVAGDELVAEPLEAAPHASVEQAVADADRESADQSIVDACLELDGGAGHRPKPLLQGAGLVRRQRKRARHDRRDDAAVALEQLVVLERDLRDEVEPPALREQRHEPARG